MAILAHHAAMRDVYRYVLIDKGRVQTDEDPFKGFQAIADCLDDFGDCVAIRLP